MIKKIKYKIRTRTINSLRMRTGVPGTCCFIIKQPNRSIKSLTSRQVADLLGHPTSEITERYYVKKDTTYLNGITDEIEM